MKKLFFTFSLLLVTTECFAEIVADTTVKAITTWGTLCTNLLDLIKASIDFNNLFGGLIALVLSYLILRALRVKIIKKWAPLICGALSISKKFIGGNKGEIKHAEAFKFLLKKIGIMKFIAPHKQLIDVIIDSTCNNIKKDREFREALATSGKSVDVSTK